MRENVDTAEPQSCESFYVCIPMLLLLYTVYGHDQFIIIAVDSQEFNSLC